MSGTSALLRPSCSTKSDIKTPVSAPSNIKVCKFQSLKRGQDKSLSSKDLLWQTLFLFVSFLGESIWYVGFRSTWYFGSSRYVTAWVFKFFLLLYTEAGTRKKTAPFQDKWLMTEGLVTFMSCNTFSDARTSLLCFKVILSRHSNPTSFWNYFTWRLFMFCRFPLRRVTILSQGSLVKSYGQDWRKKLL